MADLRIVLQLPNENMEIDENFEDEEENDGDQQGSFSTLGCGIMAFNETGMPSPLDVTTPEELLTPLARLRSFAVSDNIFNRRLVAHDACNILELLQNDENDFKAAIQCYLKLSEDLEPSVRVELMEQLAEITERFHTRLLNSAVVPILLRYLTDVNNQVRKTCHSVLIDIVRAGYLLIDQFENEIMPLLNDLTSRKQAPDEYRTEAIALICQISESFGTEFAKTYFLPIFLESCGDDTIFHVRKVCAANFSTFCDIFEGDLIVKDLLPRFIELCKDNVWGVRKSCAESFPDVAKHMPEEVQTEVLSPLFSGLLSDQSRWVRVAAFESLGKFISTFADSKSARENLNKNSSVTNESNKIEKDDIKYDFDSFLYWRNPIPPVTFEDLDCDEDSDDLHAEQEDDDEKICSQVYENSGNTASQQNEEEKIDNESKIVTENSEQNEDDVFSPTKDDVLKSIEFSADTENIVRDLNTAEQEEVVLKSTADAENIPKDFNIEEQEGIVANTGEEIVEEEKSESVEVEDEYDDMNQVPVISITRTIEVNSGSFKVYEDDSEVDKSEENDEDSDFGSGDSGETETLKQDDPAETEPEPERTDVVEIKNNDDDYYDENEPINWQSPSLQDYPDLYDCNSGDRSEIDYRMFNSLSDISYTRDFAERINGADHYSVYDPMSFNTNVSRPSSSQNVIPQSLLDNFLSMTDPSRKQTVDTEIAKHCAYSLPGVAYTLGRSNWHCLKDVYQKLATDVQWKVRRTIASSIHELAKILGEELTATELVPVFNGLLKDLDDVRIGVLRHLADFLKLLKPEVRGIYLYQLTDFLTVDNSRNWRFRYELARQLCLLVDLYDSDDVVKYICPITMRLAADRVVAVQEEAARLVATLLTKLHDSSSDMSNNHFVIFTERIVAALAKSSRWKERTLFCKMCNLILREVFLPFNAFMEHFRPALLELAQDNIVNVRINAAKALSCAAETFCDEGEGEDIYEMLNKLQNDKDRDVKFFAKISTL